MDAPVDDAELWHSCAVRDSSRNLPQDPGPAPLVSEAGTSAGP